MAFVRPDEFQFGFLLLFSSSVFQLGCSYGRTIFKFPNIAKPCPLCNIFALRFFIGLTQQFSSKSFFIIFTALLQLTGRQFFWRFSFQNFICLSLNSYISNKKYWSNQLDTFLNTMHNSGFCASAA